MTHRTRLVLILLALSLSAPVQAEGWLDRVAHALGISKTPSQMRGPTDTVQSGDIYLVRLDGSPPRQVTTGGLYRSPVFLPDGKVLLALRGEELVRVAPDGGETQTLLRLPQAGKLLGVDRDDADRLLLLAETASGTIDLAQLSLANGKLTPLPHDRKSGDQRRLLAHLKGDARDYGGVRLETRTESRRSLGGYEEWSEIYLQQGQEPPINLSQCGGDDCSQPALSPDGAQVAFVRVVH